MGKQLKTADPAEMAIQQMRRQSIVDRFGGLDELMEAEKKRAATFQPIKDEHGELEKEIASWYDTEDAARDFRLVGQRFVASISPCANERSIKSMVKLFSFFGKPRFLDLCKFNLGTVDANVPSHQRELFIKEGRTGRRRVEAVPIHPDMQYE